MINEEQLAQRLRDEVDAVPVPYSALRMSQPRRERLALRGGRLVAVGACAAVAAVALFAIPRFGAVSPADPAGHGAEPAGAGLPVPRAGIREEVHELETMTQSLGRAAMLKTQECMSAHGFTIAVPPMTTKKVFEDNYGLSLAQAKSSGYPQPERSGEPIPVDATVGMPKVQREAFHRALFGERSNTTEVTTIGGAVLEVPRSGCEAEGQEAVFGPLPERARMLDFANNIVGAAIGPRAMKDPAMVRLAADWSTCMDKAGHHRLDSPEHSRSIGWDKTNPDTRELAIADATCQESLDYANTRRALEDRYLTQYVDQHTQDIAHLRQFIKKAEERTR